MNREEGEKEDGARGIQLINSRTVTRDDLVQQP